MSKQKNNISPPPLRIHSAVGMLAAYFREEFPAAIPLIVCDRTTEQALGAALADALQAERIVFPAGIKASVTAARHIAAHAHGRMIIAVGAGAVNDICKYAAGTVNTPYACFPTALSMNGYASAGASLTDASGLKTSLPCPPPAVIYVCPEVLAAAPPRLLRAGLCDTLCYVSCLNDLELRRIFTGEPYDDSPFSLQRPAITDILSREDITHPAPSVETCIAVMRLLILSGHGMRIAGSSAPASQSEHMLCHAYDTAFPRNSYFHGEKTGMFACYTLRLQERIFQQLYSETIHVKYFSARYRAALNRDIRHAAETPVSGTEARAIYRKKTEESRRFQATSATMTRCETDVKAQALLLQLVPPSLPRCTEQILRRPVYMTRDRFTCLDIAAVFG